MNSEWPIKLISGTAHMVGIRYIYGLICIRPLSLLASSIPEVTYEDMPMDITDYVFNQHLNHCDRLDFYAASSTLYNRYKATVRQALMQPSSQGYKLSTIKIYEVWKSSLHLSDLKSMLMTHEDIKYFSKYIFNGPIVGVDQSNFPKKPNMKYSGDPLIARLLESKVHPDVICIFIDIYPNVMFSDWSWCVCHAFVTENPSKPLLLAMLKRSSFPIQLLANSSRPYWHIEHLANPEIFEMLISNSIITGVWHREFINELMSLVIDRFRSREPLELLLDLSPPNSISIYQDNLIDFIRFGVNAHKVARCCYGFQPLIKMTIDISQLLIWGAEDKIFVQNVLFPCFDRRTTPDWSQKHAELAEELGYSEQFIEYANMNFVPKSTRSILSCENLSEYTFPK